MKDGIFHQRLQDEFWNRQSIKILVDIQNCPEKAIIAFGHEEKVIGDPADLSREGSLVRGIFAGVLEHFREGNNELRRFVVVILDGQHVDRIQGVVKKMRVDLHRKSHELRLFFAEGRSHSFHGISRLTSFPYG